MANGKAKRLLTISILANEKSHILLANYLKQGDATGQVLTATNAYHYPLALAQQPKSSQPELELALFRSVQALMGQAANLINYFRLNKGIDLPPEQLARLGLSSPYPSSVQMLNATTNNQAHNRAIEDEAEDDEQGVELNSVFEIQL
jgi:hypothetical protein